MLCPIATISDNEPSNAKEIVPNTVMQRLESLRTPAVPGTLTFGPCSPDSDDSESSAHGGFLGSSRQAVTPVKTSVQEGRASPGLPSSSS